MNTAISDAELALIRAAVADAPALTSEQLANLRRILQPTPALPAPALRTGRAKTVKLGRAA